MSVLIQHPCIERYKNTYLKSVFEHSFIRLLFRAYNVLDESTNLLSHSVMIHRRTSFCVSSRISFLWSRWFLIVKCDAPGTDRINNALCDCLYNYIPKQSSTEVHKQMSITIYHLNLKWKHFLGTSLVTKLNEWKSSFEDWV